MKKEIKKNTVLTIGKKDEKGRGELVGETRVKNGGGGTRLKAILRRCKTKMWAPTRKDGHG